MAELRDAALLTGVCCRAWGEQAEHGAGDQQGAQAGGVRGGEGGVPELGVRTRLGSTPAGG